MGNSRAAKHELLAAWEKIHGDLPSRLKAEFLRRSEVEATLHYPRHAIRAAIKLSPRLALIVQELQRKWVVAQPPRNRKAAPNNPVTKKPHQTDSHRPPTRDLAPEGKTLPLPDNPASPRIKGSPGYKTGVEAELRHIAQKHQ